ncbi:hypothetical protein CNBB4070 [Cryptococcus deneoformans B-3501A]|nr:hypothetical protein CNBB4070 [Cryptococcus neoformans var. neoformans B-3501A]EAL22529.1 hypothetical protein CNBB4070 [Cryptococcus neoformans var. neoformans B-3501A]
MTSHTLHNISLKPSLSHSPFRSLSLLNPQPSLSTTPSTNRIQKQPSRMSVLRLRSLQALRVQRTMPAVRILSRGAASKHDNDPNVLAREKARNLSGTQDSSAPHKEHAPGWNEHLATDAEANVKADQAAPDGPPGKDLQEKTVSHVDKHHHTPDGMSGAEHHHINPGPDPTPSEENVKADRGEASLYL